MNETNIPARKFLGRVWIIQISFLFGLGVCLVELSDRRVHHLFQNNNSNTIVVDKSSSLSHNYDLLLFNTTWPMLEDKLCPNMRPNVNLGETLFSLARYELGMKPLEKNEKVLVGGFNSAYKFEAGGFAFIPYNRNATATIYLRVFKAANNQITRWAERVLGNSSSEGRYLFSHTFLGLKEQIKKQPNFKQGVVDKACVVTAVRDPISHYLSGYNEIEFRYEQIRKKQKLPTGIAPASLYYRYNNGTKQRFEQFVADYVTGPSREGWQFEGNFQLAHVYSMAGVLSALNQLQGRDITAYLPSINNVNEEFPKFLAEKCPGYPQKGKFTEPMEVIGQHVTSTDPYGFYRAAKEVWAEQDRTARALCALHVMDYACYKNLPDGIPELCKDVYSSQHFISEIMKG